MGRRRIAGIGVIRWPHYGLEILAAHGTLGRPVAEFVRRAMDVAGLEAASDAHFQPFERSCSREQDSEPDGLIDVLGTRHTPNPRPSNDHLRENKTANQTVSSTCWEQELRALPF